MKLRFTFLFFIIVSLCYAQNRQKAFDINKKLGRGINYGNMFEAPSLNEWGNPWKPQYAGMIARLGFNHIRVPIRWEPAARSASTYPYKISDTFLKQIKQVVDSALKNKLYVVINMHHHDSLFANPDGQKPRFLAQWKQISEYFKSYPDSLLFEILNEPNGKITPEKWNVFFVDALAEIRKDCPERVVLIGSPEWGGLSGLPKLNLPPDPNIIVTIHYYNPFQFTHQGASWVGNGTEANAWLGTKWNDTETEREVVKSEFAPLVQFSKTNNVPVHIGEFGAYSKADDVSRKKWTTYLARYFESVNFSWAYWEFSAGFGIYNPSNSTYLQYLVDALLHNPMPEPAKYIGTSIYTSNFSASNDGWILQQNTATASLSRSNNSLNVAISNGGTETWHVQLVKGGIKLTAGKKYRLTAKLKAEAARTGTMYVGMSVSPWSAYSDYNTISIADTFATYTALFDAKTTDSNARIVFDIGKSTSDVSVTEIKLEEVVLQWPTSVNTIQDFKTSAFPNPCIQQLVINNLDAFENMYLFNLNGALLLQTPIYPFRNDIDISYLSPGIYFLKLWAGDKNMAIKIVKE